MTRPKKKLNLLKRLPNDNKFQTGGKFGKDPLLLSKESIHLNSTGMNHLKMSNDSSLTMKTIGRTTTAQSQVTGSRAGTARGRTRKQIIAEFFCSQNWRYLSKKALMVRNEREQIMI